MLEKQKQEKSQEIRLYVHKNRRDQEKIINIKKTAKFSELREIVKNTLKITEEDCNWRIRLYARYEDLMQDTYDGREEETLEQLPLSDYKRLIVETKTNIEEPF